MLFFPCKKRSIRCFDGVGKWNKRSKVCQRIYQTIDTTIDPISLNFDQSCLEPDQVPLNVRQSMRSLPNDSQLSLLPSENQSSMVKKNVVPKKKQAEKRKYSCPEPDCSKSYTQSHNLKDHQRKKHKDIDWF